MYSPSRNFVVETETPSVQLPDDLQQLLNSFSKRTSESTPAAILQTDPIISAYKSQPVANDDDEEDQVEEIFSSPEIIEETPAPAAVTVAEPAFIETAPVDDAKVSRDPRRKPAAESYLAPVHQPPPPGMEEEFPAAVALPVVTTASDQPLIAMSVAEYTVPMQAAAPFSYTAAATTVPQYPPPTMMAAHPPMYMTAAPVFPQPGTLPFGPMPAAQIYVPPTVLHHDPSMIPLPMDNGDQSNLLKRKATDDIDDDDPDKGRKSDSKTKKNPPYYSSDAKSRRSDSRSPTR